MSQIGTILQKNFIILIKVKTFWINLYIPILSLIISLSYFTNQQNTTGFSLILLIFLSLSSSGVIRQSIGLIIREKKDKHKELQTLMGLKSNSYYIGWVITVIATTIAVSFVYTTPFMIAGLNNVGKGNLNCGFLIIAQCLYCISLSLMSLFLSSFFQTPSKGSEVIGLFNVVLTFIGIANFLPEPKLSFIAQLPTLFSPQTAFQMALLSQNFIDNEMSNYTLNVGVYIACLLCQSGAYLAGFMYFDQVVSGAKGPCFLFGFFNKSKTYVDFQEDLENVSPQILYKPFLNIQQQEVEQQGQPYISIENLSKKMDGQLILTDVSIDIFQNEIYCLLGPNGAGKSTLINILTGMVTRSRGRVQLLGQDIEQQQYLSQIGICLQKDILYPELSVYEHLTYYSKIRTGQTNDQEINSLLIQFNLMNDHIKKARDLSGGQKRKLCLCISLLGQTKIIFLDEPSSGMDALSRQQIWQAIKQIRINRAIILTTHHLEEAEELANRVGMLIGGRIVTQGTPDFIKLNFGVGYHLTMEFNTQEEIQQEKLKIQAELQKIDPFIPLIQNSPTSLKSILPTNRINNFYTLLTYLEQNTQTKYSLQLNSLEDSYLALDQQFGSQHLDLNAQQAFQQKPIIDFKQQMFGLLYRKILVIVSSNDIQFKFILPLFLIFVAVLIGQSSGYTFVFFYLAIKALTSTLYISVQLDDKDTNIKQYMYSSGVQIKTYWLSHISSDLLISLIESIFVATLLAIYEVGHFGNHFFKVVLVITIFGLSLSCFVCCLSQIYKASNTAYTGIPLLCFFIFFLFFHLIMLFLTDPSAPSAFCFFTILMMIISPFQACYMALGFSPIIDNQYAYGFLLCLLYLLISGGMYLTITISIDQNKYKQVQYEMNDSIIESVNVTKIYNNKIVVNNVSFSVKEKEIFGLLGPNGAGKSTMFNMITKFEKPNQGEVRLKTGCLGLVPQFCPFYPSLTIQQHLRLYGQLKGQLNLEESIQTYLKAVDLHHIKNRQVFKLSGGERRKVQLGIAMIGGSNILLMDEPTTGLDPKARRVIQQMLVSSTLNNDASVILTTHSLQEAQTICNRIAIIVNGNMIAQGNINELRSFFGNVVRFTVRCNEGRQEIVHQRIFQQLGQKVQLQPIYEVRQEHLSYQLPSEQFKMSELFSYLQNDLKGKQQLIIDFQIYQPNLEQIFSFYASQQIEAQNDLQVGYAGFEEQFTFGNGLRWLSGLLCIFW